MYRTKVKEDLHRHHTYIWHLTMECPWKTHSWETKGGRKESCYAWSSLENGAQSIVMWKRVVAPLCRPSMSIHTMSLDRQPAGGAHGP